MRGRFILFLLLVFPWTSFGQDDGGGQTKGGIELGPIGSILLPGNFPGIDETYPAVGLHFAFPVRDLFAEIAVLWGTRIDTSAIASAAGSRNHLLYIPVQVRNEINLKSFTAYGTIGGHAVYYVSHYNTGRKISAVTGGFDLGGGIIIPDDSFNIRLDFKAMFNPGTTVALSLYFYWII